MGVRVPCEDVGDRRRACARPMCEGKWLRRPVQGRHVLPRATVKHDGCFPAPTQLPVTTGGRLFYPPTLETIVRVDKSGVQRRHTC